MTTKMKLKRELFLFQDTQMDNLQYLFFVKNRTDHIKCTTLTISHLTATVIKIILI